MDNSANRAGSRIPTGDDFDQMLKESLTLALLRLSCWTEGTGELSWIDGVKRGYQLPLRVFLATASVNHLFYTA